MALQEAQAKDDQHDVRRCQAMVKWLEARAQRNGPEEARAQAEGELWLIS